MIWGAVSPKRIKKNGTFNICKIIIKKRDMMKVLESELRGKTVMSEEGLYLGIFRNSLVDERTGQLLNILVEPSEDIDPRLYHLDEVGHLVFPFEAIKSVKDVIIVGS
jgi:sporulation protein YlmC with PRC-barrel domain